VVCGTDEDDLVEGQACARGDLALGGLLVELRRVRDGADRGHRVRQEALGQVERRAQALRVDARHLVHVEALGVRLHGQRGERGAEVVPGEGTLVAVLGHGLEDPDHERAGTERPRGVEAEEVLVDLPERVGPAAAGDEAARLVVHRGRGPAGGLEDGVELRVGDRGRLVVGARAPALLEQRHERLAGVGRTGERVRQRGHAGCNGDRRGCISDL